MPTFYETAEIDVEVDDFVSACSSHEINQLIEVLIEEGHLNTSAAPIIMSANKNLEDLNWDILCDKLSSLRVRLTVEEEETIKKIIEKY